MTLTDAPPDSLKEVLSKGLADYNAQQSRLRDWKPLAVMVHDPETGDAAGGLLGRTSMGLFFVDLCPTTCAAAAWAAKHFVWQKRKRAVVAARPQPWSRSISRRRISMRDMVGRSSVGSPQHQA